MSLRGGVGGSAGEPCCAWVRWGCTCNRAAAGQRDRPCNRTAVPTPSAHERVPSASLAPASLRLARERAQEWEGGDAAGNPVAYSTRSFRAPRHRLPTSTSGGRQPGPAGLPACVPCLATTQPCPALRPRNRWLTRGRRSVCGSRRRWRRAAVSARAGETHCEC